MPLSLHPDYSRWVVSFRQPAASAMLPVPQRALVRTKLYDGTTATLEVDVVARGRGFVCVRQEIPGRAPWSAWVPADRVRATGQRGSDVSRA